MQGLIDSLCPIAHYPVHNKTGGLFKKHLYWALKTNPLRGGKTSEKDLILCDSLDWQTWPVDYLKQGFAALGVH